MAEFGMPSRDVVKRLWNEVAAEQANGFEPSLNRLPDVQSIVHDPERWYLNHHWSVDRAPAKVVGGGGFKRRLKSRAAQFVMRVLEPHFEAEQEFREHLVRLQNTLTVEHDRISMEVREVHETLRRDMERLWQVCAAMHASLEERVMALERSAAVASIQGSRD